MRMMKCESMPSCLKINMTWIWITFAVLCRNIFQIGSIQTRIHRPIRFIDERTLATRHFRHIDTSVHLDWERGLREATVQALFREHFRDGNLKKHIYSAPLLGKQDKATPFGDIAILARGQLYANYAGFIFVQDPYQNDCDDCHDIDAADNTRDRCIINHCQIWHPKNNEKLMALWKIRRIRHRSRQDGPTYEVEFTISPVGLRYPSERYLTKEGTFNYNLPGHVFVLKSSETRQHVEVEHFKHGAFIAQTVDGRKYTLTPETPRYYELPPKYPEFTSTSSTPQYAEEDEKNVYQALLNELHKKTSPESTSYRFTPTSKTSTTLSDKTLVQFPDGQVVPITDLETPFITKTTPGYVTVRFPESNMISATSSDQKTLPSKVTLPTLTNKVTTTQMYALMRPQTTPLTHRTTTSTHSHTTINKIAQTPGIVNTKPRPFYTTTSTKNINQSPTISTTQSMIPSDAKPPVKMTFHFFAAEESRKPTTETFKMPLTTTQQNKYTKEYENFLPYTLTPTQQTIRVFSEEPITKAETTTVFKNPNSYSIMESTKKTFTTKIPSTNYRPATVVKVTKPFVDDTTIYSSTFTSKTSSTTQPIINTMSSIALESSSSSTDTSKMHHISNVPITVLEESTVKTTLQHKTKFSTTEFNQPVTVAQTSKTTYTANTVPDGLQDYNANTAMSQLTNIGQEMIPQGSALLESTTYTKIPTLTPKKEPIQTTLGITTIMGTSQNKTTDMVYYAAEETEIATIETTQIAPTTFVHSTKDFIQTTEPTYSISASKPTSPTTPKRVATTIRVDGTVSVKTSPTSNIDEELFGITNSFAKKHKLTKRPKISTTSGPSDFLVDGGSSPDYAVPLFKKPSKDYSEDDIFGYTKGTTKKTSDGPKHYTKSDLEQALFDTNNRKSKALIRRKYSTTEVPRNINYSNLFEASTSPMTTHAHHTTIATGIGIPSVTQETTVVSSETVKDFRNFFSATNKGIANGVTTENIPIATTMLNYDREHSQPATSQSYLTSISYEVNKRPRLFDGKSKEIMPMLQKENDVDRTYVRKKTILSTEPKMPDTSTKNDFALRLVSHAKAVEYLEQTDAGTFENINAKTTKKSKYTRRRSYTPKAKRPTRKKVVKSKEIQI